MKICSKIIRYFINNNINISKPTYIGNRRRGDFNGIIASFHEKINGAFNLANILDFSSLKT